MGLGWMVRDDESRKGVGRGRGGGSVSVWHGVGYYATADTTHFLLRQPGSWRESSMMRATAGTPQHVLGKGPVIFSC